MLNKKELTRQYLDFIKKNHLNAEDFVVVSGGAMVMMNLRKETQDIDVNCPKEPFDRFVAEGLPTHHLPASGGQAAVTICAATKTIDLHVCLDSEEVMCTAGVWHHSPLKVLTFKRSLNRPKDQEDIRVLELYLQGKKA